MEGPRSRGLLTNPSPPHNRQRISAYAPNVTDHNGNVSNDRGILTSDNQAKSPANTKDAARSWERSESLAHRAKRMNTPQSPSARLAINVRFCWETNASSCSKPTKATAKGSPRITPAVTLRK